MNDVFTFIQNGLINFTDNGGIYDKELQNDCLILNELLNKVSDDDYQNHLTANKDKISKRIKILFTKMQSEIYTNLYGILNLLFIYQNDNEIQDLNDPLKDIRDHYFHSLQCFLLSLVLYPTLIKKTDLPPKITNLTGTLFSLSMYHDIGYLYKVKDYNTFRINNAMRSLLFTKNELNINTFSEIFFIILRDIPQKYQERSNMRMFLETIRNDRDLNVIWDNEFNNYDGATLCETTRLIQFPYSYKDHHSSMSAIFLGRILQTIRTLRRYFNGPNLSKTISINSPELFPESEFIDIIRAIFLHDFEIEEPMIIKKEFLASFLMIVDELQTYGRLSQNDKSGKKVLNPKYIHFEWVNNYKKLKLSYDEIYISSQCNIKLSEAYKKHNNKKIIEALKDKVNMSSIEFLNIDI
jgi:hypothetical protein